MLVKPLADFVAEMNLLLASPTDSPCAAIAERLAPLVTQGDWLDLSWRQSSEEAYRRQCLYQSPDNRFSIGCFVWAPNQATPIHDHRSWGVIGVISGTITSESFTKGETGLTGTAPVELPVGSTAWVHPKDGDIHRIAGGSGGGISIHVYGCPFDTVCLNTY